MLGAKNPLSRRQARFWRVQEGVMDELVYQCPRHGTVVVLTRRELLLAHPPSECPWCQGALRVECRHRV